MHWSLSLCTSTEQPLGKVGAQALHSETSQSLGEICPVALFSVEREKG